MPVKKSIPKRIKTSYFLSMNPAITFLQIHKIPYTIYDHPAAFTVEQAKEYMSHIPGAGTKNLFLRDKKGKRQFLVILPEEKPIDMKRLAEKMESTKLSFGSADRMKRCLNIEPGSVSILALINDIEEQVELFIDYEIWNAEIIQAHPLINTMTLALDHTALELFIHKINRNVSILDL